MTKEHDKNFEDSTKYMTFDHDYINIGVKARGHYQLTGKYAHSAYRDNIKVTVSHKIPILFHNLKNYVSHLILRELGKLNFEHIC